MPREDFETSLIVREARPIHSGSRNGKPFTIYQLVTTKPDGTPIEGYQLRSFFDPPKNEVLEVHCKLFHSEQFGDSYTVTLKNREQTRTQQLELVKKRLDRIEQHLGLGPFEPAQASDPGLGARPPLPPTF